MPFDESHVDEETLALLALGENAGSDAERAHVAGCEHCTHELDALRDVVGLARDAGPDALTPPPPAVWERVVAELGLTAAGSPAPAATAPVAAAPPAGPVATAPVVRLDDRRRPSGGAPTARRPWAWVAGAAAVGVVLGGVGVWGVLRGTGAPTVTASATLDPLPGWQASGTAVVETSRDGSRVLVVDLADGTPDEGGFREVWLLTPDVSGLISLGTLEGSEGRFDLPDGLDLDEFSVVDVSAERFDGDPAHSGDSIVRGPLGA
ncbi:anti-sigma factor [Cellulomonas soli]